MVLCKSPTWCLLDQLTTAGDKLCVYITVPLAKNTTILANEDTN